MAAYILRRLLAVIPTLIGVSILVFAILQIVPGDAALALAGPEATEEELENIRENLGLNKPLYIQYGTFAWNAVQGDFGRSAITRRPVSDQVRERFPATAELALFGVLVSSIIGIGAGVISATRRYSLWDTGVMIFALVGVSMPVFWLALLMMFIFSIELGWLPTTGRGTWQHLLMPGIAIGLGSAGIVARQVRSAMLEVMDQDYVRTGRAKGLAERVVIRRHVMRNASIPAITVIGLQFGGLLGGAVITETIFAWPGMGQMIVEGVRNRDMNVVQAGIMLLAATFVIVNLIVDLLYVFLDPRIKYL